MTINDLNPDMTNEQYHTRIAMLWDALKLVEPPKDDVFTLVVERIRDLESFAEKAIEKCHWMPGPCWCGRHTSQTRTPYYELLYLLGGPEPLWGRTQAALLRAEDTFYLHVDGGHHYWKRTERIFINARYNPPQLHTVFDYVGVG